MSDELEGRVKDSLRDAELPAAPPTVHAALERLELEPVHPAPSTGRRRTARWLGPGLAAAVAVMTMALVSQWPGAASTPLAASTPSADPSRGPASSPAPSRAPSAIPSAEGRLAATDDRVTLTVDFEPRVVAPAGALTIEVALRNDRPEPIILADACAGASAFGVVPVPVDPVGRTWDGISAAFKAFALAKGLGAIDQPGVASRQFDATSSCPGAGSVPLAPGETMRTTLTWAATLVRGIPMQPGEVPVSVSVFFNPTYGPTSPPRPSGTIGSSGGGLVQYELLTVSGPIRIAGAEPTYLSAGEAIDSLLADRRFVDWLGEQPQRTWSGANVFLFDNGAGEGIAPAGPAWSIELFREVGVPRNWAIGFVDPFSGKLPSLTFCNDPCDR